MAAKRSGKSNFIRIACIILLLLPVVTLLAWGFVIPEQYGDSFLGELKVKAGLLAESGSPKIVVIGGSGVAFDIDSQMLEEEFSDYEVVNFGMYAALGSKVMLDLAEPDLKEGDLVIFMPEQQEQALSLYFNGSYMWQALDGAVGLLTRIDSDDYGALLGAFPEYAAAKFGCFLSGERPAAEAPYCQSSFTACGDVDGSLTPENVMAEGYDPTMPVSFAPGLAQEEWLDYFNAFCQRMEEKGVLVFYHFCPVDQLAVEKESDPGVYYEWLSGKLDCSILGDPYECLMEEAYFYDTNFHLNGLGKEVFSRQFVRDLKAQLGDCSRTGSLEYYLAARGLELSADGSEAETVGNPEAKDTAAAGDAGCVNTASEESAADSLQIDEACFLYEENTAGYTVIGLTEEGKAKDALTVPAVHEGKTVTRIAAGAFTEGSSLIRVSLPDTIAVIEDRAFDGAASLTEIVLFSENPQDCQVGQNLLEGSRAVICVPDGSLSAYRLSYWWSAYADRLQEGD